MLPCVAFAGRGTRISPAVHSTPLSPLHRWRLARRPGPRLCEAARCVGQPFRLHGIVLLIRHLCAPLRDGGRCQRRLPARLRSNAHGAPSVHAAGEACQRFDGCPAVALGLQRQAGRSLGSVRYSPKLSAARRASSVNIVSSVATCVTSIRLANAMSSDAAWLPIASVCTPLPAQESHF